jgi:chromosomal replication initiation ATPase DnaA
MTERPLSLWPERSPTKLTMRAIAEEVASRYRVSVAAMKVRDRRRAVAHPRQEAMDAMCEAGFSTTQAAGFFGMDHSTAVHARQAVAARALAKQEAA